MSLKKKLFYVILFLVILFSSVNIGNILNACSSNARECGAWCQTIYNCIGKEICTSGPNWAECRCGSVGAIFYCTGDWAYMEYTPVSPHPTPEN